MLLLLGAAVGVAALPGLTLVLLVVLLLLLVLVLLLLLLPVLTLLLLLLLLPLLPFPLPLAAEAGGDCWRAARPGDRGTFAGVLGSDPEPGLLFTEAVLLTMVLYGWKGDFASACTRFGRYIGSTIHSEPLPKFGAFSTFRKHLLRERLCRTLFFHPVGAFLKYGK